MCCTLLEMLPILASTGIAAVSSGVELNPLLFVA